MLSVYKIFINANLFTTSLLPIGENNLQSWTGDRHLPALEGTESWLSFKLTVTGELPEEALKVFPSSQRRAEEPGIERHPKRAPTQQLLPASEKPRSSAVLAAVASSPRVLCCAFLFFRTQKSKEKGHEPPPPAESDHGQPVTVDTRTASLALGWVLR